MFKSKKILIGITGSIAAYKTIYLVRLLVKEGAEVKVVMTPSAKDFVSKLTLSTLSKNPVLVDLFDEQSWANHVMLGRWADVMVIAPLSCNTLAKMAHGLCDNLLLAVYLSATCPVVAAPAMDEDMWHHASTKDNLKKIASFGNKIIPVGKGELASGLNGEGRMAEPETIIQFLKDNFFLTKSLKNDDNGVMTAAVADYATAKKEKEKIKKREKKILLELEQTPDILKTLGEQKTNKQVLIGFALETTNEKNNALEKLKKKNADLIVLNSLNDKDAGFGKETNKITIIGKGGKEFKFDTKTKQEVAKDIVDTIIQLFYA